jgi:hypothetical protein
MMYAETKARMAPIFRREASPSTPQSRHAICQISTSSAFRPAASAACITVPSEAFTSSGPSP